jgi:hypothetical protein
MTRRPRGKEPGEKRRGTTTTTTGTPPLRLVSAQTSGDSTGEALAGELIPPGHKPKTRGPVLPGLGVTAKEEGYCQKVADGHSASDAYRMSHDASGMKAESVHAQAVRIGARDRVRARIEEILEERKGETLHDRRRAASWALKRLQLEAETAETDGARVAAVSLIMRHHALLTDRQEVEQADSRDALEIETALRQRLERLLKPTG